MDTSDSQRLFRVLSAALILVTLLAAAGASWLRWANERRAATGALTPVSLLETPPPPSAIAPTLPTSTAPASPTAALSPTPALPTATVGPQSHLVQEGDTLQAIADLYGVPVELLVTLNDLADPNHIVIGTTLLLPGAATATAEPAATNAAGIGSSATVDAPPVTPTPATPPTAAVTPTAAGEGASVLGVSYGGWAIEQYIFGDGPASVVFVGAIHGGYEWNTANLAYAMVDHFRRNPGDVPDGLTLHIIPAANPDGLSRVAPGWTTGPIPTPAGVISDTIPGRFNGRDVDLNRNWDCNWQASALWQDDEVSGGPTPFSETETAALRDFFLAQAPQVVVFWHSAAGVVLPGACRPDSHAASTDLAEVYSDASGYPVQETLNYEITGDASDWLTTQDIPSFAVELTDHVTMEWTRNLAGTLAILDHIAAQCAAGGCVPVTDR